MKEYLFKEKFHTESDQLFIVKGETPKDALYNAAKILYRTDEMFIEHMSMRAINMSFAEQFWLQSDEEENTFSETGKVMIDENEFIKRAEQHFGCHTQACSEYLSYLFFNDYESDDEERAAYNKFADNHPEFLISEWISFSDYEAVAIDEIKRL
jgi:hypothetical protein